MFELALMHSSPACLRLNGKMTGPGGEVSPGGTARAPLLSGLGGSCCNNWQASSDLLLLMDPGTPGGVGSLLPTWGEDSHVRWVQLPRSECSEAGGLYESELHEMNANSRRDRRSIHVDVELTGRYLSGVAL